MLKLQTRVPKALDLVIRRVQVDQDIAKGKAMRVLVDLALSNPEHEKKDFGDGDTANCTLVVADAFYTGTKDYRAKHGLTNKSSFFRDALYRGASLYLDDPKQNSPL